MLDDIKETIRKNLPSMVGEELLKVLKDYEDLKSQLQNERLKIKMLNDENNSLKAIDRDIEQLKKEKAELKKEQENLRDADRQLCIQAAVQKAVSEQMNARMSDHKEIVLAVFANSKYKYELTEAKNVVLPGSSGCSSYTQLVTDRKTIVTEGEGPKAS